MKQSEIIRATAQYIENYGWKSGSWGAPLKPRCLIGALGSVLGYEGNQISEDEALMYVWEFPVKGQPVMQFLVQIIREMEPLELNSVYNDFSYLMLWSDVMKRNNKMTRFFIVLEEAAKRAEILEAMTDIAGEKHGKQEKYTSNDKNQEIICQEIVKEKVEILV